MIIPCISPPMNPAIGIDITAPSPKKALRAPKSSVVPVPETTVEGIEDMIAPNSPAKMIPAISAKIAEITAIIMANGITGID